ncbi:E3 ubiquitin-protein ligase HRD1-like [Teleopsis dalmanni]|uniref:E3 ubiquitin-protein ligase HRD1-like n=1 Tax=Teleopsis dalmanni TaxID=139649 RepID=UPI0018CF5D93|nr:E3 ubiquitin-protein ligase HRD1-like [Teleopsis dalmanni]XP_037946178.1 E3 ubiquitin-protein ligase HRD1-like [Teleopsis dalmanni]
MQILLSSVCVALTSAVIGNAFYQKKQFYPSVVYITKSNASMAVIYIQFFVIVFMFGKLLRKIFLGTLRAAEFEHLLERFWYALTETCLAFTVFRDDFNPRFVALFTVLLFLKSFHWLAEERVDFMERSPVLGWLFHLRVGSLLTILGIVDYILLVHAYNSTLVRGPTVQLVFGFEYAILLTLIASTLIKYILHAVEMRTDTPWENKAVFLLYTELIIGLIRVILYVLFVVIMAKIYALPMFVFRPMFFTIRSFKKALADVILSRRAIRNMNTLYPDATQEELRLSDNICIICREDMINHAKKLPCGHIFHTTCLRSWFQRQQTCPTCRFNILRAPAVNSTAVPRQDPPIVVAAAPVPIANTATVNPAAAQTPNPSQSHVHTTTMHAVNSTESIGPNIMPVFPSIPNLQSMNIIQSPMLMPPPFPFLTPYSIPPPPIPSDLINYTDEELRTLEGSERSKVEERIKMLRNIQLLIDAAGVLMNNYQIAAATCRQGAPERNFENVTDITLASTQMISPVVNDELPSTSGATTAAAAIAASFASRVEHLNSTVGSTLVSTSIENSGSNVTIEDLDGEENDFNIISSESTPTSTILNTENHTIAELNELRKKRILKFLQEGNQPNTSTE